MIANKKYALDLTVFVCGAVVMVFELIGSRVVSPYVGTSIYSWTSLIGVILASLSVGYYVGGYWADKRPTVRPLALIILLAAVAIAFSVFIKDVFSGSVAGLRIGLEVKSVLISLVLFAPASFLLGMVSPYAVRLRMSDVVTSGRTAGNLYSLSTAGSIFGTFLAGFYIIPQFGSTYSLMMLSVTLLLVAGLLLFGAKPGKPVLLAIVLLGVFLGLAYSAMVIRRAMLVADIDTEYNRIAVFHANDMSTKKPVIALSTDPYGVQAAMFTDGSDDLVFGYTRFYDLFRHFVPDPTKTLMLGGCAYTYPRHFIHQYPNATMDVVEIDPGMTEVARKYFDLKDDLQLSIYHEDARIYMNENRKKYDVIFVDAFNSASSIPFQLTTEEFVRKEYDALSFGGVIMVNMISAINGEGGKFARAEYATYKKIFPQVFLFTVQDGINSDTSQNLMLVALKSEKVPEWESRDESTAAFLSHIWKHPIATDVPVLTDDFTPVEYYKRASL